MRAFSSAHGSFPLEGPLSHGADSDSILILAASELGARSAYPTPGGMRALTFAGGSLSSQAIYDLWSLLI